MPELTPLPLYQVIINAACKYYELNEDQLKSRDHVEKRKIVQYLLRTEADMKYLKMARLFSPDTNSHSRIMQNVAEIDAQKNVSRAIRIDIKNIKTLAGICE